MAEDVNGIPESPENPVDVVAEAKKLTERLSEIESYLASLAWKAETILEDGQFALAFRRRERGWNLICMTKSWSGSPWERLQANINGKPDFVWTEALIRDASISSKSKAAKLLPKLMQQMRQDYDRRVGEIQTANAALDQLDAFRKAGA